ncbi:MAG: SDR family oxidoreductase [Acetobacteraceae bacterium]|nr:SDR family oxidoreductase [Acetobacteraceae bacterium]
MGNVIVTGGSRGLGLAIARKLAEGGDRVIALARHETAELAELAARPTGPGWGAVCFWPCDLSVTGELRQLVRRLRNEFGAINGLVNNAGLGTSGMLATLPDVDIERLVAMNVLSPILLTKYVARAMMVGKGSRIVSVSSIVAENGYKGLSVYAATKAALVGFTRSLARELGPLGITVNAVAPGFVDTEMTRELNPGQRAQIMRRSALQRMPEPQDIADVVAFLFSEAARNMTGTVLTVDAGNTA